MYYIYNFVVVHFKISGMEGLALEQQSLHILSLDFLSGSIVILGSSQWTSLRTAFLFLDHRIEKLQLYASSVGHGFDFVVELLPINPIVKIFGKKKMHFIYVGFCCY